jgi:WD40 repeat protein
MNGPAPEPSNESRHFENVLAQFLQAEEQGLQPDPKQFLESHPECADRLRAFFRDRDWFAREAPPQGPTSEPCPVLEAQDGAAVGAAVLPPGGRFARYEIISQLGIGGMGIVYKAEQINPKRLVALKVIRADRLALLTDAERRRWIERFHNEARTVAALDQPAHIVGLHEVGERDNQPYFTMRYVEGGSLAKRLREVEEAGPEKAATWHVREQSANARLLAAVARAVHYAHQRGILHRDLKPANVLLDTDDQPLVTDFGLARRLDETGSVVALGFEGTAGYVAPEQARAERGTMTTAVDVYGLGAILYELLTGRAPFQGANDIETVVYVLTRDPVPPRRMDRRLSRDLETICLKCLEKEPSQRYASAAAVAEDLENWLAGRPINARPASTFERAWRWCRRNPVPTVAACLVLTIAVSAFVLIADSRNDALALAGEKGQLADANGTLAEANDQLAHEKTTEADRAREGEKKAQREAVGLAFQQAKALSDQGEVSQTMHVLAHYLELAQQGGEADLERLFRANLAAWRYHLHTLRRVLAHPAGVSAVAWSPHGQTLATACWDRTTQIWDLATGKARVQPIKHDQWITGLAFSPDGKTLLTSGYSVVTAWDVDSGRRIAVLDHQGAIVTGMAFAPEGRTIVTGSNNTGMGYFKSSSLDGQTLVTDSNSGIAQLWDSSGKRIGEPLVHRGWIEAVACAPDGRHLATGGKNGRIIVWDLATRQPAMILEHPGGVTSLAFGPEGQLLSGGEDRTARLWDLTGRRIQGTPFAHQAPVKAVALSPDGSLALTGSLDQTARVWDTTTGQPVGQPLVYPGDVLAVAFGPDGRTVAIGGGRERGDARVWDISVGNPLGGPLTHAASILAVAVSPDGKRVATAGRDMEAHLWDARTAEPARDGLQLRHLIAGDANAVVFSPDCQFLVSGGDDGTAQFWWAATGQPVLREDPTLKVKYQLGVQLGSAYVGQGSTALRKQGGVPIWFDHDTSTTLAKAGGGPIWGPGRGKSMAHGRGQGAPVYAISFRPDGKQFVTVGANGNAVLWDAQRGGRVPSRRLETRSNEPVTFGRPEGRDLYAVAFSPDGRLVAVGGEDGFIKVWDVTHFDVETFLARMKNAKPQDMARLWDEATVTRRVGEPLKHAGPVVALAFNTDSKTLLSGSGDGTARLWDVSTGKAIHTLKHLGPVISGAFNPDGSEFVTGSWDGAARIWKTATGEQAGPPLTHRGKMLSVAFSRDGHTILTGSEDWTARLWDAATGQPIGPALRHQDQVRATAIRPDGLAAITVSDDRTGRLWPIPAPAEGSAEQIRNWVEALTGMRRTKDGSIHLLEAAEWEKTCLRQGTSEPVPPEDRLGWHRQQARTHEAAGRWWAARWHLDRLIAADPTAAPLYQRRAKAALAIHDLARARADLDKAIALMPAEPELWLLRGNVAIGESRWQDGVDNMNKALELKNTAQLSVGDASGGARTAVLVGRGYARAALGQWKAAAADLAVVRDRFQQASPSAWRDYALVLLKQGDLPSYRTTCRQCSPRSPARWESREAPS